MQQIRISRKVHARGGRPEPTLDVLPTVPASDTRAAAELAARIDATIASR